MEVPYGFLGQEVQVMYHIRKIGEKKGLWLVSWGVLRGKNYIGQACQLLEDYCSKWCYVGLQKHLDEYGKDRCDFVTVKQRLSLLLRKSPGGGGRDARWVSEELQRKVTDLQTQLEKDNVTILILVDQTQSRTRNGINWNTTFSLQSYSSIIHFILISFSSVSSLTHTHSHTHHDYAGSKA